MGNEKHEHEHEHCEIIPPYLTKYTSIMYAQENNLYMQRKNIISFRRLQKTNQLFIDLSNLK
jgi:hypothetical protein